MSGSRVGRGRKFLAVGALLAGAMVSSACYGMPPDLPDGTNFNTDTMEDSGVDVDAVLDRLKDDSAEAGSTSPDAPTEP